MSTHNRRKRLAWPRPGDDTLDITIVNPDGYVHLYTMHIGPYDVDVVKDRTAQHAMTWRNDDIRKLSEEADDGTTG